jgi:hypothetical protein
VKGKNEMANHKDLDVWKLAIELAKEVYELTASFSTSEIYGLVSQISHLNRQ